MAPWDNWNWLPWNRETYTPPPAPAGYIPPPPSRLQPMVPSEHLRAPDTRNWLQRLVLPDGMPGVTPEHNKNWRPSDPVNEAEWYRTQAVANGIQTALPGQEQNWEPDNVPSLRGRVTGRPIEDRSWWDPDPIPYKPDLHGMTASDKRGPTPTEIALGMQAQSQQHGPTPTEIALGMQRQRDDAKYWGTEPLKRPGAALDPTNSVPFAPVDFSSQGLPEGIVTLAGGVNSQRLPKPAGENPALAELRAMEAANPSPMRNDWDLDPREQRAPMANPNGAPAAAPGAAPQQGVPFAPVDFNSANVPQAVQDAAIAAGNGMVPGQGQVIGVAPDGSAIMQDPMTGEVYYTNPQMQMLQSAGWTGLPQQQQQPLSFDGLDMSAARTLTPYQYQMEQTEWDMLQADAANRGLTAPGEAKDLADLNPIRSQVSRSAPMTREAYDALGENERRAVDYNTLLVEAREADLLAGNTASGDELEDYNNRVHAIFGDYGGTEQYAPNTLKLLEEMGFQATGQDIDEFISLERGFTSNEVADLKLDSSDVIALRGGAPPGEPEQKEEDVARSYTNARGLTHPSTAAAEEQRAETKEMLESNYGEARNMANALRVDHAVLQDAGKFITDVLDKDANAFSLRSAAENKLGLDFGGETPYGWVLDPDQIDTTRTTQSARDKERAFQGAFGWLQDTGNTDMNDFWDQFNNGSPTDEDRKEFVDYLRLRAQRVLDSGESDPHKRSAQEILDLLAEEG